MEKKSLKIGCGEWGFRDLPLEQHFIIAQQFGFKSMEFGIGGDFQGRLPGKPDIDLIRNFKAMSQQFGIRTPVCCLESDFTLTDQAAHDQMLVDTAHQLAAAAECGASQVRLFAGFTPAAEMTEKLWAQLFAAFDQMEKRCRELGLTITVETHGRIAFVHEQAVHTHTVTTHPEALERFLKHVPKSVGINYDPGNLKAVAPEDHTYALPLLSDRINYCHLKDWKKLDVGWVACAIGDDDLDYGKLLRQMSYDGLYMIEYEPTHDLQEGIQRSLDYLHRIGIQLNFA